MTARPVVVYWNNQPTPYLVDRLNAVADLGTIDIRAWFDVAREPDRSWELDPVDWRFEWSMLEPSSSRNPLARIPLRLMAQTRPDLLICNYDRLHMVLGAFLARRYCRRVAIRALPTFPAWTPTSRRRELAKHALFRSVDGAKVPGDDGRRFVQRYGLPADRVWPVTQSIARADYRAAREMNQAERAQLRAALGLDDRCAFIYVGRIWSGKGLDTLFDAFARLEESSAQLLIVGDGVDLARYRAQTATATNIRWHGFVQPDELPGVYAAADVLVFPTLGDPNGLVVEEAMASGLPVISSDAAGDIRQRLPDGKAGFVVPAADPVALADRMAKLAADAPARQRMGQRAADIAAGFGTERYAADFSQFVQGILAAPPRWQRRSKVKAGR